MRMPEFEEPPAEISRDAHPGHTLKLVTTDGAPFRCDGCKEPGSGKGRRYRCSDDGCDFDLHIACAMAEPTLKHPLFGDDLEFQLLPEAPPPVDKTYCNACGFRTPGLVYHCFEKDLDIHPTCAALKAEAAFQGGHQIQLCWEAGHRCVVCGKARPQGSSSSSGAGGREFWAYRWGYGGTRGYLHVSCMKKIAFQSWKQAYQVSVGGGLVEASVPTMAAALQKKRAGQEQAVESGVKMVETGISLVFDLI